MSFGFDDRGISYFFSLFFISTASILGKRKVEQIKEALTTLGWPTWGKRAELEVRLTHVENVKGLAAGAAPDHKWTVGEVSEMLTFLRLENRDNWEACEVVMVAEVLNARFCSDEVMANKAICDTLTEIKAFSAKHLAALPRAKNAQINADALIPMMTKLLRKDVTKWGDKEGNQLLHQLGDVATIDARASSPEAIESFSRLSTMMAAFFVRRPDWKAKIDPEIVIFDLSGTTQVAFNAALAGYLLPGHLGMMPAAALNPGVNQSVFALPTVGAANHFIGWMSASAPGLRAVVVPGVPAAVLVY